MRDMDPREPSWLRTTLWALVAAAVLVALVAAAPSEQAVGLLLVGLVGLCLVALELVLAALWPRLTARARASLEAAPARAFLAGLVNYVFLGALGLVLLQLGPLGVLGLALGAVLLIGTALGLPSVAGLVGARLHALREQTASGWGEIVAGGLALDLAVLVPVLGWFILAPALCIWSLGAVAVALLTRQRPAVAAAPFEGEGA